MRACLLVLCVSLLAAGALVGASRVPLQLSQQPRQESKQQQSSTSSSSQLPPQWPQLQRDLQANQSRNGSHAEFVTLAPLQRLPKLQVEGALALEQQADKPPANMTSSADCGKPWAPCGVQIPAGLRCEKGPGWCQKGYFCGWESTTVEPSRCLPLPDKCGQAGCACCPSNTERPHSSLEDKLTAKPFCREPGSVCIYFAPVAGLNNGDMFAANKGAYACTKVAPDCGGEGKACCPFLYKVSSNPPLQRTGCNGDLFCNYDSSGSANASSSSSGAGLASPPGVCTANARDCGAFGKSCCIFTGASATGMQCGARWNETGRRGYCADPSDASSSSNDARNVSSQAGSRSSRQASYKDLVCMPCPDKRTPDVAANPSKYWPC